MSDNTSDNTENAEARREAREYIMDGIANGDDPWEILDGLSSFWDGDLCDLF